MKAKVFETEKAPGEAIAGALQPYEAMGETMRTAAQMLNRRGLLATQVETANTALLLLAELLYAIDEDGVFANVDDAGRVLVPLPWGRRGSLAWGLRAATANAMRWLMIARAETHQQPLLVYEPDARTWSLNLGGYADKLAAVAYLRKYPISLAEWRQAWTATRSQWAGQHLDGAA